MGCGGMTMVGLTRGEAFVPPAYRSDSHTFVYPRDSVQMSSLHGSASIIARLITSAELVFVPFDNVVRMVLLVLAVGGSLFMPWTLRDNLLTRVGHCTPIHF